MSLGGGSSGNSHHTPYFAITSLLTVINNDQNETLLRLVPNQVAPRAFCEEDEEGNTPIHLALRSPSPWSQNICSCFTRHPHIIYPEDVDTVFNTKNREGNTPMHLLLAATGFHEQFASRFLRYGNFTIQNMKKETPLHLLLQRKGYSIDFVKQIFNRCKVNVNQQDEEGNTYLHLAAQHGDTELAHVLLAKGATNRIRNNKGMSPLDVAMKYNQDKFVASWKQDFTSLSYHQPGFSALLPLAIVLSRNPRRNTDEEPNFTGLPHRALWSLMDYLVGFFNKKVDEGVNFSELPVIAHDRIADYVAGHPQGHMLFKTMIKSFNNSLLNAEGPLSISDAPLETQIETREERRVHLVHRSLFKPPKVQQEEDKPCCSSSHEVSEEKVEDRKGKRPAKGP